MLNLKGVMVDMHNNKLTIDIENVRKDNFTLITIINGLNLLFASHFVW